jgi:hypothetical protein
VMPPSGMLSGLLGRRAPAAGALAGSGWAGAFGGLAGLPEELISAVETRAIWARFGF